MSQPLFSLHAVQLQTLKNWGAHEENYISGTVYHLENNLSFSKRQVILKSISNRVTHFFLSPPIQFGFKQIITWTILFPLYFSNITLRTDLLTFGVAGAVFGIVSEMCRLPAYFDNPDEYLNIKYKYVYLKGQRWSKECNCTECIRQWLKHAIIDLLETSSSYFPLVFKRLHFWNRFRKPPFSSAFLVVLVRTKGQNASTLHWRNLKA